MVDEMKDTLRRLPVYAFRVFALCCVFFMLQNSLSLAADGREVIVYTALDQVFSEPILQEFEKRTNIKIKAVYDIEAVKTTGLVNRLLAEKDNPRCDVFWNNEIMRTIALKRKGVLSPYISPSAKDIPAQFKDKEGYWTGFAARARVLVVNTNLVKKEDFPKSINDLLADKWQGQAAMAHPLFGTTSTHVAALFALWGAEEAKSYLAGIKKNGVKIVDGNSVVRDMTAAGEVHFGITDTDDANVGIVSGKPIAMILPDQDTVGTFVIPNTVSIINNAPHPEEARILIDFLLSHEVEEKLSQSSSAQIPLHQGMPAGVKSQLTLGNIVALPVDYEKIVDMMDESVSTIQDYFMR